LWCLCGGIVDGIVDINDWGIGGGGVVLLNLINWGIGGADVVELIKVSLNIRGWDINGCCSGSGILNGIVEY